MPARLKAAGTFYKGHTIASIVRTRFGQKAVYVPAEGAEGGIVGHIVVEGIATPVEYASEYTRDKPISRQSRWESACSEIRDAIYAAEEVYSEKEDAESNAEDDEDYAKDFDLEDAEKRLADATDTLQSALATLEELISEYQDWYDNLPEALQYAPVGEKLQEVTNLYVDTCLEFDIDGDTSDAESVVDEFEYVDLPQGWGRD